MDGFTRNITPGSPADHAPAPAGRPGLDAVETASRDELAALQLARLRATLHRVYADVPHYRAAFDAHGVHPDDCRDLADLARFPFTDKDDLRAGSPYGMLAVDRRRVARLHASSGTTGQPTVVGHTAGDLATWAHLVARSLYASGVRPGMTVHVAYGYGLFTGGLGAHYGAERLGCTVVPVSGGQTERQVRLIQELRPDAILVTPSYLLVIADALREAGVDPATTSLRHGVLGAEPWTESMRGEIETALGIDAVDIYGLSEMMGPGVANECVETKDGPTLWEDHFYPEVVDPVDGAPVPDGAFGELVLTSLTREAMPVVRYRTRDLTRLLPGTARTMRRMERITGRSDDMMIIRGVNVFPTQIEEQILHTPDLAPHFECVLTRPGRLDELTVRVERRDAPADVPLVTLDRADELGRRIKEATGVSARVEVVPPRTVPRSAGKAKRVVDLRVRALDQR